MTTQDAAQVVSALIQTKWALTSPKVTDIDWPCTRYEAVDYNKSSKNYFLSCYNPGSPATVEQLSREAYQQQEDVYIDIIVKTAAGSPLEARENMRKQVYDILHANQFLFSGYKDVFPVKEPFKVEHADLMRLTIQVRCRSFHVTGG